MSLQQLLLIFFGLIAAGMVFNGVRIIARIKHIQATPTSRLRSAAQGYVEVAGKAIKGEKAGIRSALTHKPCVLWGYTIHEYKGSGKNKRWQEIESRVSQNLLGLIDGTGHCLINPAGAEIQIMAHRHESQWNGFERIPAPGDYEKSKTFWGIVWLILRGGGRYRYEEWRIEEGDELHVMGELRTLTLKDGVTRTNLMSKPSDGRPLLISDQSEAEMILALRWQSIGSFISATAMVALMFVWG